MLEAGYLERLGSSEVVGPADMSFLTMGVEQMLIGVDGEDGSEF